MGALLGCRLYPMAVLPQGCSHLGVASLLGPGLLFPLGGGQCRADSLGEEQGEFLYVPCCEAVLGMIHCVKMHFSSDFQQQYNGAPPLICGAQQKVINGNDDTVEERRR